MELSQINGESNLRTSVVGARVLRTIVAEHRRVGRRGRSVAMTWTNIADPSAATLHLMDGRDFG